jgi:hypothetical protein
VKIINPLHVLGSLLKADICSAGFYGTLDFIVLVKEAHYLTIYKKKLN